MSKYPLSLVLMAALGTVSCASPRFSAAKLAAHPASPVAEPSGKEVSFAGFGGLNLKGTYIVPPGANKCSAMLLLPGSGPTDRDGNQLAGGLQVDTLKDIANALAAHGIATLRFDKRAVSATYKSEFPKTLEGLDTFFSWDAFVGDAEAALSFLRAQPEVDPGKCGVLGHSEGGAIALAMAEASNPNALVLVSTAGRDLGTVIIEQVAEGYGAQFQDPETLKKNVAETKRLVAAVRDTHRVPKDVPDAFKPLFPAYLSKYLYSVFTFRPTEAASKYRGPVLIVQGEKDIQVSAKRDAPALLAAFPKGRAELYEVPNATHCLKKYIGPKDPGFQGPTNPDALKRIAEWVKIKLG